MAVAGKTIAITGAARGLGQEFARHLAASGANIVVGDINDCAATVDLVANAGGKTVAVTLDVTDAASAQAMVVAVGNPRAASSAKLGPEMTAIGFFGGQISMFSP